MIIIIRVLSVLVANSQSIYKLTDVFSSLLVYKAVLTGTILPNSIFRVIYEEFFFGNSKNMQQTPPKCGKMLINRPAFMSHRNRIFISVQ
jgi:hypothetical protein